jgi:hypothetical protein
VDQVPLFQQVSVDCRQFVCSRFTHRIYAEREMVICEGDDDDLEMYFVKEG